MGALGGWTGRWRKPREPTPIQSSDVREQRRPVAYDERVAWAHLLGREDVLIVGTETTGVGEHAEVVEVALIDTTGEGRYFALSLPAGGIAAQATKAHGWTPRTLREAGARHWPEVHDELLDTLRSTKVVLGWNVGFDQRMLFQTAERHQRQLPRLQWRDVMRDYAAIRGGGPRHRLEDAAKREGVARADHTTGGDCEAVLGIMRAVVEGPTVSAGKGDRAAAAPRCPGPGSGSATP